MYNSEVKIQLYTDIIIYTYKHKYKHCMSQVPTDNMYLVQPHPISSLSRNLEVGREAGGEPIPDFYFFKFFIPNIQIRMYSFDIL